MSILGGMVPPVSHVAPTVRKIAHDSGQAQSHESSTWMSYNSAGRYEKTSRHEHSSSFFKNGQVSSRSLARFRRAITRHSSATWPPTTPLHQHTGTNRLNIAFRRRWRLASKGEFLSGVSSGTPFHFDWRLESLVSRIPCRAFFRYKAQFPPFRNETLSLPCWASNDCNIPYHDNEWGVPLHSTANGSSCLMGLGGRAPGRSELGIRAAQAPALSRSDGRLRSREGRRANDDANKSSKLLADPGISANRRRKIAPATIRTRRPS